MTDTKLLVGAWQLVFWEEALADGSIGYPYGRGAIGYLIYTGDGYMSAEIMDPDRRQSDPDFPLEAAAGQTLSEGDRARAYSTYLSYCGTYTVEGDTVTHHVKAGLVPSWTGSDQRRRFTFDQGCLIIRVGAHTLVWERAVRHG